MWRIFFFWWDLTRRFWTGGPSRNSSSILPSFHSSNLFAKHSWWPLALDFSLGFWSTKARRTKAAFKAIWWLSVLLFQSLICFVIWSMNSLPIFPYETKKIFLRHEVISLYALKISGGLTVITFPSDWPQAIDYGVSTVENSVKEPCTSPNGFSSIVSSRSISGCSSETRGGLVSKSKLSFGGKLAFWLPCLWKFWLFSSTGIVILVDGRVFPTSFVALDSCKVVSYELSCNSSSLAAWSLKF